MIKKILNIISRAIIDNIPFFIILGILSLFGDKYEYIKSLRTILAKFIIPSIMGYSTGNFFAKKYGGIASVVVLATTFHSYNLTSFLEPIIIGIICGFIVKKYLEVVDNYKIEGTEMIFNNLGISIISIFISFSVHIILPYYTIIQNFIKKEISTFLFNNHFLPLFAIFIEPLKVFFLNNLINHSVFSVLGLMELNDKGKSIFLLLETNPGPGLGILIFFYLKARGNKNNQNSKELLSNIFIQFFGGIHEVYFPYVLKSLKYLIALVIGSMSSILFFQHFNVGLFGIASPGSFILITVLAPWQDKILVVLGILLSTIVTIFVATIINEIERVRSNLENVDTTTTKNEKIEIKNLNFTNEKIKICVSCDAGMGSSAMGATLLKKKLLKEGVQNFKVIYSSVDNIPSDSDIIVVHEKLIDRIKNFNEKNNIFTISDFMDTNFYDNLAKEIKNNSKVLQKEKGKILEIENIKLGLKRVSKDVALKMSSDILFEKGYVDENYISFMLEREKIHSTYLSHGIAIPHCTVEGKKSIKNNGIVVLQFPYGIDYGDGNTVYIIIAIACLGDSHIEVIKKIAEIFDNEKIAEQLSTTTDINEFYNSLSSLEEKNVK